MTRLIFSPKTVPAILGFLLEIVRHKSIIGIGWGTTTHKLVQALPEKIDRRLTVVQVSGGNTKMDSGIDSQALTVQLAGKFGVSPALLHAPAIVDRAETRRILMEESSLKEVFSLYKKMDILIAGIGAFFPDKFVGSSFYDQQQLKSLHKQGAVAEFLSYCFETDGNICSTMTLAYAVNLLYQYADNVAFLLLTALGLIIILGVLDIINLARGEMIMMGFLKKINGTNTFGNSTAAWCLFFCHLCI